MGIQLNGITGDITTPGDVGIGGTLTYEDVTNVDSVGVITARGGIRIGGGTTVGPSSGIVTYFGDGSQLSNITSTTINNNADNRIITGSGTANRLEGESNLTFNGTNLLSVHVPSATGEPAINFTNSDTGTGTSNGFGIGINDAESPYIYNRENTDIRIATNNTERFRIGSSGQFGIGGATYGTSGQVLTSGGASAAPTWAAPSAAGSVYDTFHGQGFSAQSGNGYYTSGWGKPGGPGGSWANGPSGKLITESSGIFSFPSTGIYYISHRLKFSGQNINMRIGGNRIYGTNSNANPPAHQLAEGQCNINSFSGTSNGYGWACAFCECIVKITNTSNDKVAFWWQSSEASNIGSGEGNMAVFFKLADLN